MGWYSAGFMAQDRRQGRQGQHVVHLEFSSAFGMLDLVQVVGDHIARELGLDEESIHWTGVAVRESVINAIKHGNQSNAAKHVFVEFQTDLVDRTPALIIRVRDQGAGFDPDTLEDPMAPENLLKSSGRGIFLIRSFMDDVRLQRAPEGGMEILMTKRVQQADATGNPLKA
jgi:serine/threonine-protein kinase RsbW